MQVHVCGCVYWDTGGRVECRAEKRGLERGEREVHLRELSKGRNEQMK